MDSIDPEDLAVRLRMHVQRLAGEIGERNPVRYAALEAARAYIEQDLRHTGYEIRHDAYEVAGRTYRNVVAERPGSGRTVVVIGAHYDTAPGTPGADDNASGVGVLLELARALSDFAPGPTLRWIAFTLEEPPYYWTSLMGSRVHARKCRNRAERILGMISLEMAGYYSDAPGSQWYPLPFMKRFYPDRGNFIALAGNLRSRRLVRRIARRMSGARAIPVEWAALPMLPGAGLSDNWSFWQEGYPALMITDTAFLRNPHYHAASDLPETLDYSRMAAVAIALDRAIRLLWGGGPTHDLREFPPAPPTGP
jgi:Zn-dependent M28 family amino/carboxypeptidase